MAAAEPALPTPVLPSMEAALVLTSTAPPGSIARWLGRSLGHAFERDRTRAVDGAKDTAALDAAMDRYARGDDTAFAEVYDKLAPRLFGFLLRQTRDRARAEDVVQQTMLQIHRARGRFLPGAEVTPWAFAIARRLLIDQHRRGGREVLAPTEDDVADVLASLDAPADEVAIAKEVAARLGEELQRLPDNQRVAFELIKQDGLSVAEAAAVLGTTVAAVKLRAHRAYEALRAALGRDAVPGDGTRAPRVTDAKPGRSRA
jgi:RNA polymerase sigma-70 factor, ECF subfamily